MFRCHLGRSIVYDTVSNLSWSVDIRTHGIANVVESVLGKPWPPSEAVGREVPLAEVEQDCMVRLYTPPLSLYLSLYLFLRALADDIDLIIFGKQECYSWEFGDFPPGASDELEAENRTSLAGATTDYCT